MTKEEMETKKCASICLNLFQSFGFVFSLFLLKSGNDAFDLKGSTESDVNHGKKKNEAIN